MLLAEVVETSAAVAATRSRKAKVASIAALLGRAEPAERALVARYLGGTLRQRRTGLGWRGLQDLVSDPADTATLEIPAVDRAFDELAALAGPGSRAARDAAAAALFASATADEQRWLRGAVTGEVRQGALEALVTEALAQAADVPLGAVRRAAMLAGGSTAVVNAAFAGPDALDEVRLEVGRPVVPMLASPGSDVDAAWAKVGGGPAVVDTKLDGIRVQVHRDGEEVLVATRSLDDITDRLPEVVEIVRALPATSLVLDGEALALDAAGRPRPFQETASRTAQATGVVVTPFFFDLLHLDGVDLLDAPGHERWAALERLVPAEHRVHRAEVAGPEEVTAFADAAVADGHEGVVLKRPDAPWEAGRRGAAWVKVKPVHTLDLIVLAVEWGSGRRRGLLSNIHLGARGPDGDTVMLGKTFKGMTDEMLAWQTERFLALETHRDGHVVHVRPEQVVEIALDGVQRSTRYPGGVALRFARVVRYRDDKTVDESDTVETVRSMLG